MGAIRELPIQRNDSSVADAKLTSVSSESARSHWPSSAHAEMAAENASVVSAPCENPPGRGGSDGSGASGDIAGGSAPSAPQEAKATPSSCLKRSTNRREKSPGDVTLFVAAAAFLRAAHGEDPPHDGAPLHGCGLARASCIVPNPAPVAPCPPALPVIGSRDRVRPEPSAPRSHSVAACTSRWPVLLMVRSLRFLPAAVLRYWGSSGLTHAG